MLGVAVYLFYFFLHFKKKLEEVLEKLSGELCIPKC